MIDRVYKMGTMVQAGNGSILLNLSPEKTIAIIFILVYVVLCNE